MSNHTPDQRRIRAEIQKRQVARAIQRDHRTDSRKLHIREGEVIGTSGGPPPSCDLLVSGGPMAGVRVIGGLPRIGEIVTLFWSGDEPFVVTGGAGTVFIQEDTPRTPGPWLWVKTGLQDEEGNPTAELWVEDGL